MNSKNKNHQQWAVLMLLALASSLLAACQGTPTQLPPKLSIAPTPNTIGELIIAVDGGNPPFRYEKDNKAVGLYPMLVQEAFKRMGVAATVKTYPWKRALEMGKKGEVGIAGILKTEERLQTYDYSEPLYTEKFLIYVRQGSGFEFNNINDLKGKTLGVLFGWNYGDTFDQAKAQGLFKTEEVSTDSANFEKLLLGRVDCVVAIELTGLQIIQGKQYAEKIEVLDTPLAINDTYLVFAKSAQQTALLEKFNAALAAIRQDGTYLELLRNLIRQSDKY
jgi:polar amino acid transport system substrate-binding protein